MVDRSILLLEVQKRMEKTKKTKRQDSSLMAFSILTLDAFPCSCKDYPSIMCYILIVPIKQNKCFLS